MPSSSTPATVAEFVRAADRYDELADTAELMGDVTGAGRFRADAARCRAAAMALLDGRT